MSTFQFRLPIGAKRQVTIPRELMRSLSLEEGHELLLEVAESGDRATLTPIVSIPRTDLPKELQQKFLARRGSKPTDIPLGEFLGELRSKTPSKTATHRPLKPALAKSR